MIVHENYSLKNHNTFGIDVAAKYFAEVNNIEDIIQLLAEPKFKISKKLVIGVGSNILFTKDFNGLVITQTSSRISIRDDGGDHILVTAEAGVIWHNLVLYCVERNLGGIENLSLIPGKVGAAPIQNIGAYGQELKDVLYSVQGIDLNNFRIIELENSECKFGYRDSIFKNELKNKIIITAVTLQLTKNPKLDINYGSIKEELSKLLKPHVNLKDVSDVICKIRQSKLPDPLKIGNAGSFFKNPEIPVTKFKALQERFADLPGYYVEESKMKIPAGWLIEKCGFKGKRFGNVGVHEKQALVMVNYGNALPEEVVKLKEKIKEEVKLIFDIELKEEVNIL